MGRLDNQVALITGGASGLGAAIVRRFVKEGASVLVLDRSEQGCADMQAGLGEAVHCVTGDVRSMADNENAVATCLERFGKLDCAIGNAGIWDYNLTLAKMPAERLEAAFDEMFSVNVLGYLNLARASLSALATTRGSMIFTISNAGFWPSGGGVLYTATKHAAVGMVRQLAWEFAPHVRVNGVAPGAIATQLKGPESLDMQNNQFPAAAMTATAGSFVPLGEMPTPEEYAGAWVFFASREDNVPSTGVILNHDGGFGIRGLGPVPRGGDDLLDDLNIPS
ncbi:MAG: 3-(cis-5,6-dihydroxycyclohexa-1,3-dien-1-yl)propanoate dehydrogenase [Pseudomonadales bacterium]|nr:3-(cis-5,6-dihydroxycyclohexa-1,3-dien-1-yl)propanoate dehydrogenase [Pseudomonadales bacterium]